MQISCAIEKRLLAQFFLKFFGRAEIAVYLGTFAKSSGLRRKSAAQNFEVLIFAQMILQLFDLLSSYRSATSFCETLGDQSELIPAFFAPAAAHADSPDLGTWRPSSERLSPSLECFLNPRSQSRRSPPS